VSALVYLFGFPLGIDLMPGSDPRGGWSDGDLSRGGRYVKGSILKYARDYAW